MWPDRLCPLRRQRAVGIAVVFAAVMATAPGAANAASARAHLRSHGADPAVPAMRRHATARAAAEQDWCGPERALDDTASALQNGAYRYHAIYLRASDAPDRFRELAGQMQADALGASALLERLYGRAIRYDMGTACGTGYLDISAVQAPLDSSAFEQAAGRPNGTLELVARLLARAGFPTLRSGESRRRAARLATNYVVWLDAPAPANTCGAAQLIDDATRRASNWNNLGGKVAVVFRSGAGFCGADAIRHEVGHTLGAIQAGAPHAFDGSHCDDAYEDTMCYASAPVRAGGAFENEFFDYGNDDYWDPPNGTPLGWWTVNLSRFICPTAVCNAVATDGHPAA